MAIECKTDKNYTSWIQLKHLLTLCLTVIRDPHKAAQMAERPWRQYLENWTYGAIQPSVWAPAEDCLRRSGKDFSTRYQPMHRFGAPA
jgi:hypothetical protein